MSIKSGKISTIVLWTVMIVSLVIIGLFFFGGIQDDIAADKPGPKYTSLLLYWMYILFVLVTVISLLFSIWQIYKKWKYSPKSILKNLIWFIVYAASLVILFFAGDGTPLKIAGYEGNENTYLWLKLTDVWLYLIYGLLSLVVVSIFGGIIWSYLKK